MKFTPSNPQLLCRSISQAGNFGFDLAHARFSYVVIPVAPSTGNGRGLRASCARRLGDAVDPAPLLFGRAKTKPELLLQGSREDTPHGMTLPPGGMRHLIDRCALGSTQHCNHRVLLRRPLRVEWRLRLRQGLDRRPQLID